MNSQDGFPDFSMKMIIFNKMQLPATKNIQNWKKLQ